DLLASLALGGEVEVVRGLAPERVEQPSTALAVRPHGEGADHPQRHAPRVCLGSDRGGGLGQCRSGGRQLLARRELVADDLSRIGPWSSWEPYGGTWMLKIARRTSCTSTTSFSRRSPRSSSSSSRCVSQGVRLVKPVESISKG